MSKVLVTGATGFVGRLLCNRLIKKGYKVIGTIRSPEKLTLLPKEIEFSMVDEIGLYTNWAKTLNEVDTIIHLAARVHVMHETSSDTLNEYRRVIVLFSSGSFVSKLIVTSIKLNDVDMLFLFF